jgi:hypothetical protein
LKFGALKSTAIPVNSSAPISGVFTLRVSPSMSFVIPATVIPPLSNCVPIVGLRCKNVASAPTIERKVGFSENEAVSLGVTLVLKSVMVSSLLVPSEKIKLFALVHLHKKHYC